MTTRCCLASLLFAVSAYFASPSRVAGADWPQWQGPDRTNVSAEKGLLKQWPEGGPPRAWLYENGGHAYSGPSIVKGVLYTMGTRDNQEIVLAVDANTGAEKWAVAIDDILENGWGNGPRATPTFADGRVYALSGKGTLACVTADSGQELWRKTMADLGGSVPSWGYCESVLVDGPHVICTPGGPKGTIAALNKDTGELVWQSAKWTDGAQYSSLIIAEPHGVKQYIQLTMEHVGGVSAVDGRLLWQSDWPGQTAVVPTPIFHDDTVYVTAGYGVGSKRVRINVGQQVEELYFNKNMKNQHGGVVLVGGHLYGYSDGLGWVCQDFETGKVVWKERSKLGKGALSCADGMLYCVTEDEGLVVLAEASPDGWKEHGRFTLDPQSAIRSPSGRIWTHPVISGGKLYLRDQEFIYCYDVKTP